MCCIYTQRTSRWTTLRVFPSAHPRSYVASFELPIEEVFSAQQLVNINIKATFSRREPVAKCQYSIATKVS